MEWSKFVIVGLAGSLRRASIHKGLIRAASEEAPAVAPGGVSCDGFDLGTIPFFNQDVEDRGDPAAVREPKDRVREADAVLISTPEYDWAIPGTLTAALDWSLRSRYGPSPFRHKPVGIVGASPGGSGTARGQMVLRQILLHAPAYAMPEPQMLVPFSGEKFGPETGDLTDEDTRERLRRFIASLVDWSGRLGHPRSLVQEGIG